MICEDVGPYLFPRPPVLNECLDHLIIGIVRQVKVITENINKGPQSNHIYHQKHQDS